MRTKRLALAALVPLAGLLTVACGTTSPSPGAAYTTQVSTPTASMAATAGTSKTATMAVLTIRKTSIGDVLATSTGMTLYWYGDDVKNSGKSNCNGGCLQAWPALTGTPSAAAGVMLAGKLGTITRSGGVIQATYNGYPLYTYANDMSPGQTTGNGVGGVWHVITGSVLSKSLKSSSSSKSTSSGSGSSGKYSTPSASASSSSGAGW
jgi:predicted lipoprotein with Yx(FWY)xxD motif